MPMRPWGAMGSGLKWRGSVALGVVLAVLAVVLSTPGVGAAPAPPPTPTPAPRPVPSNESLTINPRTGPIGTDINFHGVCSGTPVPDVTPTGLVVVALVVFSSEAYTASSPPPGAFAGTVGTPDPSSRHPGAFAGTFGVPAALSGGEVVTGGAYFVSAHCCLRATGCTRQADESFLAPRVFCVTPPACDDWNWWAFDGFGSGGFYGALIVGQIADQFAPPAAPAPSPPPPETTPTTRRRTTPTTVPPTVPATEPPTEPPTTPPCDPTVPPYCPK